MLSFEKFAELHKHQLDSVGLPSDLRKRLYDKLSPLEVLDASDKFHIDVSEGTRLIVQDDQSLEANSDVFLAKHTFFSDGNAEGIQKLDNLSASQLARLEKVLCSQHPLPASVGSDRQTCTQLSAACNVAETDASKLLTESEYDVINALWRHWDPDAPQRPADSGADAIPNEIRDISFDEFKRSLGDMEEAAASSEEKKKRLYAEFCRRREATHKHDRQSVEHLTTNYSWTQESEDAPDSGDDEGTVTVRIPVAKETKKGDVISQLSKRRWKFGTKSDGTLFEGDLFDACITDESYWTIGKGSDAGYVIMTLQKHNPKLAWEHVVVGEVALSNRLLSERAQQEEEVKQGEAEQRSHRLHQLLQRTWLLGQTYQAITKEGHQRPVWYVMDAYASALVHSDEPSFRCAPFVYAMNGQAYSIYWPVRTVRGGGVCSRDYVPSVLDKESKLQHRARLWTWQSVTDSSLTMGQCPGDFLTALQESRSRDTTASNERRTEAEASGCGEADDDEGSSCVELSADARCELVDSTINVFVDKQAAPLPWSKCNLCRVVHKASEARWMWLSYRHTEYSGKVSESHRLNRIDGEECVIDRSLMSYMLRSAGLANSPWFVAMYDLHRELAQTIGLHWDRGVRCHWLVQPARSDISVGMRTVLTRDMRRVARLAESIPSVALPFNPNTDIVDGHRYLLHYSVAVCSVKPLAVFLSLRPVVRQAAKQASPQDWFDEYGPADGFALPGWTEKDGGRTLDYEVFDASFNKQHKGDSGISFDTLQYSISQCIRDVFQCAADHLQPSCQSSNNAIAMYGVDFIIAKTNLQPRLLGVTSTPVMSPVTLDSLVRVMAANCPSQVCQKFQGIVQIV